MQVIKQTEALVLGFEMLETTTFSADPTHFFVSFALSPQDHKKVIRDWQLSPCLCVQLPP